MDIAGLVIAFLVVALLGAFVYLGSKGRDGYRPPRDYADRRGAHGADNLWGDDDDDGDGDRYGDGEDFGRRRRRRERRW